MGDPLDEALENVLIPLVTADGGRLELVERGQEKVVIRLSGACSGCPGFHYTRAHVVVPLLERALGSGVAVVVEHHDPGSPAGLND